MDSEASQTDTRQHETETDPREDLELTDWEAVDQFTQQFVRRLR